nr:unnamed protein product [Callosobruchus chinensis]
MKVKLGSGPSNYSYSKYRIFGFTSNIIICLELVQPEDQCSARPNHLPRSLRAKEDDITDVDILQLRERVRAIEECRVEFENLQAEIEENIDNESDLEKELNERESFENIYFLQISLAQKLACEDHFVKTTERNIEGRFVVSMPMKLPTTKLGDSLAGAKKRFLSLESKLTKNDCLRKMYCDFMEEYAKLGHMERVKMANENAELHPEICEIIKSDFMSTISLQERIQ